MPPLEAGRGNRLTRWHPEPAADGQGFWFVGLDVSCVNVIAPPAVALGRRAEPPRRDAQIPGGWRWATWTRPEDRELSIDQDPADVVRELDTTGVLILIGDELRELVWSCLWAQLQIARQVGRQSPGHVPSEDLARAGALSAAWIQHELARAFPDRTPLLEPDIAHDLCEAQATDDLLACQGTLCPDEDAALGSIARWFTYKADPSEHHCPNHRHIWHAGEPLSHTCQPTGDPGDHSEFDWADVPAPGETDPLTEELLLP
jgi:hypothetical protein